MTTAFGSKKLALGRYLCLILPIKLSAIVLSLASLGLIAGLKCQATLSDPVDYQHWTQLGLQTDLGDKCKLEMDWQGRWQNNARDFRGNYLSLGSSFQANKRFHLLGEYRYSDVSNRFNHRFTLGLNYDKKLAKGLKLNGRILVQNRIQDFPDEDLPVESALYYRLKIQLNYKINKRIDCFASVEPICKVGGDFPVDNWRNTLGVKFDVLPNLKLQVFGMARPDYGKANYNRLYWISGINCTYSIKR